VVREYPDRVHGLANLFYDYANIKILLCGLSVGVCISKQPFTHAGRVFCRNSAQNLAGR
jgi:hypothetical protein